MGSDDTALFSKRFGYTPAGDLAWLSDGNGHTTQWHYDEYGQATNKLDALNREVFRWTYAAAGRPKSRWTPAKGITSYDYDPMGNLLSVVYPTTPAITSQYDALNRVTNWGGRAGYHALRLQCRRAAGL